MTSRWSASTSTCPTRTSRLRGAHARGHRQRTSASTSTTSTPRRSSATAPRSLRRPDAILVPGGFGNAASRARSAAVRYARERHPVPRHLPRHAARGHRVRARRAASPAPTAPSSTRHAASGHRADHRDQAEPRRDGREAHRCASDLAARCASARNRARSCPARSRTDLRSTQDRGRAPSPSATRSTTTTCRARGGASWSGAGEERTAGDLVEMVELPNHPWFFASQFHPEFTSNPRATRCSSSYIRRRSTTAGAHGTSGIHPRAELVASDRTRPEAERGSSGLGRRRTGAVPSSPALRRRERQRWQMDVAPGKAIARRSASRSSSSRRTTRRTGASGGRSAAPA